MSTSDDSKYNTPPVLGVDGGGSFTRAAIVGSDGRLLALGSAGPSNYDDVGIARASANVGEAVRDAAAQAGVRAENFGAAFLGMAGVVDPADRAVIREIAARLNIAPASHVGVDHDIRIALAGGLAGAEGIALIAGTGSSCYGERADGRSWRCGGWGSLLDDVGGAYDLGRRAMVALVRATDGRAPATQLSGAVLCALRIESADEILRRIHHHGLSRTEIASLARLVTQAATEGDEVAIQIIVDGADELALLVATTARVLFNLASPRVVLLGGLAESPGPFREALLAAIKRRVREALITAPSLPPVLGSAILALRTNGIATSESIVRQLRDDWKEFQDETA